MVANEFTSVVRIFKKTTVADSNGQPTTVKHLLCRVRAKVEALPISEGITGDIPVYGIRYSLQTWRNRTTDKITPNCVAVLADDTEIEIDSVVPGKLYISFEGVKRDAV